MNIFIFILFITYLNKIISSTVLNAYYDINSMSDDTGDAKFIIPHGVFQLDFTIEGNNNMYHGFAFSGSFNVMPNDKIKIIINNNSICGTGAASKIYLNDKIMAIAAGGGIYSNGATFTDNFDGLGGEGVNGCGTLSYYDSNLFNINQATSGGTGQITLFWTSTCNEQIDLLNTEFKPILLPSSSLYTQNDIRSLQLDISLPLYYYNVTFNYGTDCVNNIPDISYKLDGCNNLYYTNINYDANSVFNLVTDDNNAELYLYNGYLHINASLDLEMDDGWTTTRHFYYQLPWEVILDNTVQVSTAITADEEEYCSSDYDCNLHGCCEQGKCNCQCNERNNGYFGLYCEHDIEPPTCSLPNDIEVYSNHGSCLLLGPNHRNMLISLPEFADNNDNKISYIRTIEMNGEEYSITEDNTSELDLLDICYPVGYTIISYKVTDEHNLSTNCNFMIHVIDQSKPFIDCHQCQTAGQFIEPSSTINLTFKVLVILYNHLIK